MHCLELFDGSALRLSAVHADVARGIGKPSAVRAVASACGNNKIALAIPCHRVVRGDGQLAGFKWGLARKQALIALEKTICKS